MQEGATMVSTQQAAAARMPPLFKYHHPGCEELLLCILASYSGEKEERHSAGAAPFVATTMLFVLHPDDTSHYRNDTDTS